MTPDPFPSERRRVLHVGRWRIALFFNGPYRMGWHSWSREHHTFAARWFVVSMLRRRPRAR